MILSRLAPLVLLPLVAAGGVHKLKLQKLQPASQDFTYESARIAEKYGAQLPLMGSGGAGRNVRLARPTPEDGLLWAQDEFSASGGHQVPLTS
jgi:saccharopepsin